MAIMQKDISTPDKYDLFIQKIDHFQYLVEQKKELQEKIAAIQNEYQERIQPLESELSDIIRELDKNLAKIETTSEAPTKKQDDGFTKYGRGELGIAIKELLRSNPDKEFKPKDIAKALNTKGTAVSLWFNKYGLGDDEIERIPAGAGGKRFVYKIR